jgi:predicted HTH transcriptional regulator
MVEINDFYSGKMWNSTKNNIKILNDKQINKSEPIIHRHIDVLVSKGYIKRVGSRKTGYWDIVN